MSKPPSNNHLRKHGFNWYLKYPVLGLVAAILFLPLFFFKAGVESITNLLVLSLLIASFILFTDKDSLIAFMARNRRNIERDIIAVNPVFIPVMDTADTLTAQPRQSGEMTWLEGSKSQYTLLSASDTDYGSMSTNQTDTIISRKDQADYSANKFNVLGDYFDIVFADVKNGVIIHDEEGLIQKTNAVMERMLGFSQHEFRSKKLTDLLYRDDKQGNSSPAIELRAGVYNHYDIETQLLNYQEQTGLFRLTGSPIKAGENKTYYLVMIEDIFERKEADKVKDAFVDMVAHELKNPLMAVISSLRLAKKEGQLPDVLHELVGIASDGAESLWSILENMLEVSKERAGRLKLSPVSSNMSELITEVTANVRQTLIHRLSANIPENLPAIVVDPARIRLILRNLIDNAIKYSPKGGEIIIFVKKAGEELIIGVKDEGIGISKNNIQHLFQPFERLGVTNAAGSGLGLAVCHMLVMYHKGRIWAESEIGKGSTFFFALPVNHLKTGAQY